MTETKQEMVNCRSGSINGASSLTLASAAQRPQLDLEKVLAMSKGEEQDSYSQNSSMQAFVVKEVELPELNEALEHVSLLPSASNSHGRVVIAELGCSSGPNAISSVMHIVQKLRGRFLADPASPSDLRKLEFQAFFNDLPSNDFNTLFQLLSSGGKDSFFAGGVPGSFFGRLFPRSSVHVFFSSMSVHWLSKIPDAVVDKNSPAFNKGRVWINDSNLATITAYKKQAASDLENFLTARAAELVPGGLLFFAFQGRCGPAPHSNLDVDDPHSPVWTNLNAAWDELILMGILTEEQRDTFNFPLYYRTIEDVMEAVESCGSVFEVQTAKYMKLNTHYDRIYSTPQPALIGKKISVAFKSVLTCVVEGHIGKDVSEIFWRHFEPLMETSAVAKFRVHPTSSLIISVVALIRK